MKTYYETVKRCQKKCQNVLLASFRCFWRISLSALTGNPVSHWIVQTHTSSYPGSHGGKNSNFCTKSFVEETYGKFVWSDKCLTQDDTLDLPACNILKNSVVIFLRLHHVTSNCHNTETKRTEKDSMNKCLNVWSLLEVCDSSISSCNPGSMTCTWALTYHNKMIQNESSEHESKVRGFRQSQDCEQQGAIGQMKI